MKRANELMLMIARFLHGELDAETFSFEFPAALADAYETLVKENGELCAQLEEEMPELCASFDPHGTGEDDVLDAGQFRAQVMEVYQKALPLSMRPAS